MNRPFVRPYARPGYRPWGLRGRVYVGGPRYYPGYSRYYYYSPVPSYYGYYTSPYYYPVEAAPTVAAPSTAVAVVAPPARPELPRFGIGLFAGGVQVKDIEDSTDVGLLGRFRLSGGLLIEGEIGKTSYEDDLRVDRRIGGSLVYEIGARNALAPYLLAGIGVQQAEVAGGDFTTTQNFGELGIGLRWAVSPHFHLLFDVRAGTRESVSEDSNNGVIDVAGRAVMPPPASGDEQEDYTRARLSAMLYF